MGNPREQTANNQPSVQSVSSSASEIERKEMRKESRFKQISAYFMTNPLY